MSTYQLPIDDKYLPRVIELSRPDKIVFMALGMFGSTGKRIKALRTSRDINQKDMMPALKRQGVEVGQSFISQIESDRKQPPLELLVALARVLGTTTDYLLMVTDDPTPAASTETQIVIDIPNRTERALIEDWIELMQDIEPDRRDSVLRSVRLLLSPPKPQQPRIIE